MADMVEILYGNTQRPGRFGPLCTEYKQVEKPSGQTRRRSAKRRRWRELSPTQKVDHAELTSCW